MTLVAAAFVFAHTGIPSWIAPAPLVRLGIASPFTGMTRSFVALASGHLATAFAWHPLGPLVFAACIVSPLAALKRLRVPAQGWWLVAALFAVVWVRQIVAFR